MCCRKSRARACECESMRNRPWGLVVRTPAVGDRSGDVSETYHEGNAHQGCPRGRLCMVSQATSIEIYVFGVNICSQRPGATQRWVPPLSNHWFHLMADATAYFLRSGDAKPAYHKIVYVRSKRRQQRGARAPSLGLGQSHCWSHCSVSVLCAGVPSVPQSRAPPPQPLTFCEFTIVLDM